MSVVVIVTCDVCKTETLTSDPSLDATTAVINANHKLAIAKWGYAGDSNGVKKFACVRCVGEKPDAKTVIARRP